MSDGFRLIRKLGHGAMAEVFLAERDTERGVERVALKRILPPLLQKPRVLQMFKEEAVLLAHLSHPAIPRVIARSAEGESPWMALEFVDGVDLERALRELRASQETFAPELALHIATRVAAALACAHGAVDRDGAPLGIVHRDVSPSNVLLSWEGDVKLADFGVARHDARERRTRSGAMIGKLSYMAPEQLRGARADQRADVFSWGVLTYQLLAGRHPFGGNTPAERMRAITRCEFPPLEEVAPKVPAAISALVDCALQEDPDTRPEDAGALIRALELAAPELGPNVAPQLGVTLRDLTRSDAYEVDEETLADNLTMTDELG